MNRLTNKLFLSRILAVVIISNFTSLVVLNLFRMRAYDLVYVYLASFFTFHYILSKFYVRKPTKPLDKFSLLMISATLVILTLPRLIYFSEWIPRNTVLTIVDDYARLAELISMTLSEHYPLQHPANQSYLFSFYYASLYPMALMKFVFPFLTLKDVIVIGNLLYHTLILMSLLEVSHLLLNSRSSIRVFVFLCTLFGGLDWFADPTALHGHFEWWQHGFNGNTLISSFYTGMFYSIHHFVGFYGLLLAYVVVFYTKSPRKLAKEVVTMLLLGSCFYSSPFSVLAVPLFALPHIRIIVNKLLRSHAFPFIAIAMVVPLYVFVGRLPSVGFVASTFRIQVTGQFWFDKILSAPLYFVLVPLIEFAGIPFLLLLVVRRMPRIDIFYFVAAMMFFGLTYILAFSGANNFSCRGMLLPTVVVFLLFAKHFVPVYGQSFLSKWGNERFGKILLSLVVGLLVIGTIKEFNGFLFEALNRTTLVRQFVGRSIPNEFKAEYRELARSSDISVYTPDAIDRYGGFKYCAEKFITPMELEEMQYWEKEFLRLPRRGLVR